MRPNIEQTKYWQINFRPAIGRNPPWLRFFLHHECRWKDLLPTAPNHRLEAGCHWNPPIGNKEGVRSGVTQLGDQTTLVPFEPISAKSKTKLFRWGPSEQCAARGCVWQRREVSQLSIFECFEFLGSLQCTRWIAKLRVFRSDLLRQCCFKWRKELNFPDGLNLVWSIWPLACDTIAHIWVCPNESFHVFGWLPTYVCGDV